MYSYFLQMVLAVGAAKVRMWIKRRGLERELRRRIEERMEMAMKQRRDGAGVGGVQNVSRIV